MREKSSPTTTFQGLGLRLDHSLRLWFWFWLWLDDFDLMALLSKAQCDFVLNRKHVSVKRFNRVHIDPLRCDVGLNGGGAKNLCAVDVQAVDLVAKCVKGDVGASLDKLLSESNSAAPIANEAGLAGVCE